MRRESASHREHRGTLMRHRFAVITLFLAALVIAGCGKERITPPIIIIEPHVQWIAIDTTGFDIAMSDTIRGTAGNYGDSAVVVLWQLVQELKSEQWSWRWWEVSADGDSVMTLDQGRWNGVRQPCRCRRDSIMVVLTARDSLATMPRTVGPGQTGEVLRHGLATARLP